MRILLALLALVLAVLVSPLVSRADEYDDDGKDGKKADRKQGTPEAEAHRDKQRWETWVKKLGNGPIYRVEVLFRGEAHDRDFYFLQHYVSPTLASTHGMPGLGLDSNGKIVLPYNPLVDQRALEKSAEKGLGNSAVPPLAKTTRYIGVSLERRDVKPGEAAIHVSDVATAVPLPKKRGDVEVMFFDHAAFRLELVSTDDVLKAGPLRQDAKYFRDRTETLKRDILKTRREQFVKTEKDLVQAAYMFQDLDLIDEVRKALDRWIDLPPNEFAARSFPTHLTYGLAAVGDARDGEAFHRLLKHHPNSGRYLTWSVLRLVERTGTSKALPLLEDMIKNAVPRDPDSRIEVLRELDPIIPVPTYGDFFVIETIGHFHLKPTCYELSSTQQKLDALQNKQPLTDRQRLKMARCIDTEWLFLTEADRRAGVDLVLDWYKQYQPPANK